MFLPIRRLLGRWKKKEHGFVAGSDIFVVVLWNVKFLVSFHPFFDQQSVFAHLRTSWCVSHGVA